jgi:polyhydroxyalkanoate synthesis regulator phasin
MRCLLILSIFLTGCVCLNPDHKRGIAPSVETGKVIENLKDTKDELVKAGEANTEIGKSVNKALTLAERLDDILEEIERSQNKNVIEPQ